MIKNLKEGDVLECVSIHGNAKDGLTIGKRYTVVHYRHGFTVPRWGFFKIIDDNGKVRRYSVQTKMFINVEDSKYTPEQEVLLNQYGNGIEQLMEILAITKNEEQYKIDRQKLVEEFLPQIVLAGKKNQ